MSTLPQKAPGSLSQAYQLLALVALSGELPASQLSRLAGGTSYKENVVKSLKRQRLLLSYYKNGLRGYRLTAAAKKLLLERNPERFSFYLSGSCATNHIRSEPEQRLRLHRVSQTLITMRNANVSIFRDEKLGVFRPGETATGSICTPAFYSSREIKEMGTTFVKIRGARSVGVLLTPQHIHVVYNMGNALMKWSYKAEMRTKALMQTVLCRERMPHQYHPDAVRGLLLGDIIRNTGSEKGDHFWNAAEMNLLKALVLYVALGYPSESRNIGEVYKLLVLNAEKELDNRFSMLPASHPARAPYALFSQSSDTVRSGVIIGLGSRLQVFQNRPICQITSHDEIAMELPGKQPCAYFCITSDQDSTFDFLTSLFLSFAFIKLIRYADKNCADRRLPVPVHVLGEELTACGVIPDLSRKISVIRSRGVSMSCVFQNLAGLQNRYPYNQWQEILGCCDYQLALGCTDELTAKFLSDRTGEVSVHVSSKAKQLGTWRISNYTPEFRETSGVGKRKLLTMDEVLRLPVNRALVIARGNKVLQVDKYD